MGWTQSNGGALVAETDVKTQRIAGLVAALRHSWALERLWPSDEVVLQCRAECLAKGGVPIGLRVRQPFPVHSEPTWPCDRNRAIDAEFLAACTGVQELLARGTWITMRPSALARHVHVAMFGAIWPDGAGRWRTHDLNIGVHWTGIAESMHNLDLDFALWLDEGDVAPATARLHVRYEHAHPFVDGNGRSGRLVTDLLRWRAGLPNARWAAGEEDARRRYLAALVAALAGAEAELISLLE